MKRGEVRWFTFRLPDKRRPVLVLTRNDAIPMLNTVTVVPVTYGYSKVRFAGSDARMVRQAHHACSGKYRRKAS